MQQFFGIWTIKHQTYFHYKSIHTSGCKIQNVQKFAQYSIKQACIDVCKSLHNFAYMQNCYGYMQNCYSNSAYIHRYCSFVFFFSLLSLALSDSLSPSLQHQEEEEEEDNHNIRPTSQPTTTNINPPSQLTNHHHYHHHSQPITTSI